MPLTATMYPALLLASMRSLANSRLSLQRLTISMRVILDPVDDVHLTSAGSLSLYSARASSRASLSPASLKGYSEAGLPLNDAVNTLSGSTLPPTAS